MKVIKLLAVLFITAALVTSCNSNSSDEKAKEAERLKRDYFGLNYSHSESSGYKGKVKSVKKTEYHAYSKFGDIVIDTIISQQHIKYNEDGYVTYKEFLDKDHYTGVYSYEYTYTYEKSDGKHITNCFTDDTLVERTIEFLNDNHFPTQTDVYNSNGELSEGTKYKYEENNRLLERVTYNRDGRATQRLNGIKYDRNVFPCEYTEYNYSYNDNKKEESITTTQLAHDEYGRILSHIQLTDGKKDFQMRFTYKGKGDKLSSYTYITFIDGEENFKFESQCYENCNENIVQTGDEKPEKTRNEFERDSKENITKINSFVNDEPNRVTITEFEYYE